MSWTLRRMALYVNQSKYLQKLKENDEMCSKAFEQAKFMLFHEGKPLLSYTDNEQNPVSIVWSSLEEAQNFAEDVQGSSVLINIAKDTEDKALFAFPISSDKKYLISSKFNNGNFIDMRRSIMTAPHDDVQILSRGYSLLQWNKMMKFCPSCASPLKRNVAGTHRICSANCDPRREHFYPPTFPVAITRVEDYTGERVILVRQPRHPKGMYSCVAGFVEPGETLEGTVRREIAEEVGVVVDNIQFFRSQTWPLPMDSLMLACTARAMPDSDKLDIDTGELENAKWFTREEVAAAIKRVDENLFLFVNNENNEFIVPPKSAIAYHLLKDWVLKEKDEEIKESANSAKL